MSDYDCRPWRRVRWALDKATTIGTGLFWTALGMILVFIALVYLALFAAADACERRGGVYVRNFLGFHECVMPVEKRHTPTEKQQ